MLTCKVCYIPVQLTFRVSVVYAYNSREERRDLWGEIISQSSTYGETWLLVGDFNSMLHCDDRLGGNLITWSEVADFENCIEVSGLT